MNLTHGVEIFKHFSEKRMEELITVKYSPEIFDELERLSASDSPFKISLDNVKEKVKIECLRKINNRYYAILMQDDNKKVILYFNKDNYLQMVLRTDRLSSKKEFSFIKEGITPYEDVIKVDECKIGTVFSARERKLGNFSYSWHIMSDGYLNIIYTQKGDRIVASSVHFYSEDDMKNLDENSTIKDCPQLLKIDKKSISK